MSTNIINIMLTMSHQQKQLGLSFTVAELADLAAGVAIAEARVNEASVGVGPAVGTASAGEVVVAGGGLGSENTAFERAVGASSLDKVGRDVVKPRDSVPGAAEELLVNFDEGESKSEEGRSVSSWADQVEEEESLQEKSVSASVVEVETTTDAGKTYGSVAAVGVKLGTVVDIPRAGSSAGSAASTTGSSGGGFFKEMVKSPRAKDFAQAVNNLLLGRSLSKKAEFDTSLVMYTAATIPPGYTKGVEKLRCFASIGDAAMTAELAVMCYDSGRDVRSVQWLRSQVLSDVALQEVAANCPLTRHFVVASGVSLSGSKTGATAVEAVAGLVYKYGTPEGLRNYMRSMGILSKVDLVG